ncbi:MAG: glyoxalase superfamily protein [Roseibium sp.]|uniref:glyoxalase superfamily protein n=1 Tax=Roseibium sp. TaxID=1936156 RepID=UPI003D9C37CB
MSQERPPKVSHIAPVLRVKDLAQSIAYYRDSLKFTVAFEWADGEGEPVRYAVLEYGKAGVHLTQSDQPGGTTAYCFVDGIDAYHALAKAGGANITEDIKDQPWRMREFETRDPDGNVLLFGEHLDLVEMREKPGHRHLWDSFWYHGIFHPHDHDTPKDQTEG